MFSTRTLIMQDMGMMVVMHKILISVLGGIFL